MAKEPEPEPEIHAEAEMSEGHRREEADPIVATLSIVVPDGSAPGTQLLVRVPASALRASGWVDTPYGLAESNTPTGPRSGKANSWARWSLFRGRFVVLPALLAMVAASQLALPPVPLHWQHEMTPGWRYCLSPFTVVEKNPDEDWRAEYAMSSQIFAASTPYQDVAVYESEKLGRVLTLDGALQVRMHYAVRTRLWTCCLMPLSVAVVRN